MKSPSERGVTGAWAYQARQEAGLSVEQVAHAVARKGQAVTPATIRGIESGSKKPGARLLRLLGDVLESTPPGAPVAEPSDRDDVLAAAIDRQSAAMVTQAEAFNRLADSIDRAASGVIGQVGEFRYLLRDLLAAAGAPAPAAPDEGPLPLDPGRVGTGR